MQQRAVGHKREPDGGREGVVSPSSSAHMLDGRRALCLRNDSNLPFRHACDFVFLFFSTGKNQNVQFPGAAAS